MFKNIITIMLITALLTGCSPGERTLNAEHSESKTLGSVGSKISTDGVIAYIADDDKILVPYDFYGNYNECIESARNRSLVGCTNPRLPDDKIYDLPEATARDIISYYENADGFWTSIKAEHANIEIVGAKPNSVHYAGVMGNYFEIGEDGVAYAKFGYDLKGFDDSKILGLLVVYDVNIDEFEFIHIEDTAELDCDTNYRTAQEKINKSNASDDIRKAETNYNNNTTYEKGASQVSSSELSEIEQMLNTMEVNGFVSYNFFDTINDIDLNLVFREYNYGKFDNTEIVDEYQNLYGEVYTGLSVVSPKEIKETYRKYTGTNISDSEIKSRLNFDYLQKYDVYCNMHGDTSYYAVKCVDGIKKSDNTYIITLDYGNDYYHEVKSSILTLKKNKNSYIFVSNVIKEAN